MVGLVVYCICAVKFKVVTRSDCLLLPEIRGNITVSAQTVLESYEKLRAAMSEFAPVLARNLAAAHLPAVAKSWQYLVYHTEMLTKYLAALVARAGSHEEERAAAEAALIAYVRENEVNIHKVYDVWQAVHMLADSVKAEHEYEGQ
jgi:hypothetical protein